MSGGVEDIDDNGVLSNRVFSGHFLAPNLTTGRGQASLTFPNGVTNNYSYYVVNRGQFIIFGTDPVSDEDALTLGSILAQTSNGFTNASLNGVSVPEVDGVAPNSGSPEAVAVLGFFTADGHGNATTSLNQNKGGTLTQQQVSDGTYNVTANGRVTLAGFGGTPPILYLSTPNQAFVVGQDTSVTSGILEPQTRVLKSRNRRTRTETLVAARAGA